MPDWTQPVLDRIRNLGLSPAREADIADELASHLEERYRELLARGLPAPEAERAALEELESGDALASRLRATRQPLAREPMPLGSTRKGNLMESFWHDLKVAIRMLAQRPAFSLAVAGMLAIGVAGNAAIFSVFNAMFLRPLPFPGADRLVDLDETAPKWNLTRVGISNPDYDAWQKGNKTFESMAFADTGGGANLATPDGGSERIKLAAVTKDMLHVLGLKPLIGRDIQAEDDRPKAPAVLLLGYDLWQRQFHGDRNVAGLIVKLSGRPHTVIGVLPREAVLPPNVDAWVPLAADVTDGGSYHLGGTGRLKPGVTIGQAKADLTRIHFSRQENAGRITSPVVFPARDRYVSDFKIVTRILLGAVAVVLLIACVNIAGLMLVRGEGRSREIAIRTAIGASRGRIARQLITEGFVLAAAGGICGVALGKVFLTGLASLMPDDLPKWIRFDFDGRFALFCIAITALAGVLFSLAPVLQASALDTRGWLQEAARNTFGKGRRAMLGTLVTGEVALSLVLLSGCGLILQAFQKVMHENPGFRPDHVLTFSLRPSPVKYPKPEQRLSFYQSLLDRLRALPGVRDASAATIVPLDGHSGWFYRAEGGRQFGANEQTPVVLQVTVLPGYLKTMGIRLASGRDFDERDNRLDAPKVVMINETFARFYWGTTDVVGKRVAWAGNGPTGPDWFQVIGVFKDMRHYGLDEAIRPEVFASIAVTGGAFTFAVRTDTDPHTIVSATRQEIQRLDPNLPMFNVRTMTERLDRSLWTRRAYSWLFAAFAAVAILLAAAGIYGVISFGVSQRTREIGIRMALGARPGQVLSRVLWQGMLLVAAGVAIGLTVSQLTARLLTTLLFGVSTRDLATYAGVILGVALVGLVANFVPARRAARIHPVEALRSE